MPIPSHTITMDFVTALPTSDDGYDALLSITDKFTKCVKFIPCKETITAQQTAELYVKYAYTTFGIPVKIISDRDPRFTSSFWKSLCKILNISLNLTTAYHPAADGQSEKSNQIIETALRCLIGGETSRYGKWTTYLPILEHEINSAINVTTNYSPNELRYVIPPKSISDITLDPAITSINASAEQLCDDLRQRRQDAINSIAKAQKIQKKYVDSKRSDREFEEGELAVLKFSRKTLGYKPPKEHSSKLGPLGTPVRIIKKFSAITYKIALPAGSNIHDVVSIAHLRKFGKDTGDIRPLPIHVESGDNGIIPEWEVESIKGERIKKGKKEYLVKWKGYSNDESTWEPLEHLENANELLLEYIASTPDSITKTTRPRRTDRSSTKAKAHFILHPSDQLSILFNTDADITSNAGESSESSSKSIELSEPFKESNPFPITTLDNASMATISRE